jgi:short-subunit dehydrogenase
MNNKQNLFANVFITGASSGIGAALAVFYASKGVTLGLVSRDKKLLQNIAKICMNKGSVVWCFPLDVVDADALKNAADSFYKKAGGIDLVVANAGIRSEEDYDYTDVSSVKEVMNVNYLGAVNTIYPFVKYFKKAKSGQIAIISSIASYRATPNSGSYSASKGAVNLWSEGLRLRLKDFGISVTTICMSFVKTSMTSDLKFLMPGILTTEKAAILIAKSIKRKDRTITIPWQSKIIWSILRVLPDRVYDYGILIAKKILTRE